MAGGSGRSKHDDRQEIDEEIVEEYEDNRPTGVEETRDDDERDVDRPYDPKLIRVDTKPYSVRQILDMIKDGDLDIAPDFQRKNVWKPVQKSRLIESVLLRIPLPAFYFSADNDGRMQVVDGIQRLSTLNKFCRGGGSFPLVGLEYLEYLEDKRYGDLESLWIRRILTTTINANVIDPQTPDEVKFDIFRRLNTGGTPLGAQEIRHCLTRQRSRDFLAELAALPSFQRATQNKLKDHCRMADREFALRFCAFHGLDNVTDYGRKGSPGSMEAFLTSVAKALDDSKLYPGDRLAATHTAFDRAMTNAYEIFGEHAFRKWPLGVERLRPLSRALFEVWSVALARYDWPELERHRDGIVAGARELMGSDDYFMESISVSTGAVRKVHYRFETVDKLLNRVLGSEEASA